jgi:hypothetical protein
MAFVAHDIALNVPLKDGSTRRANLEVALERYDSPAARRELLEGPQCPPHLGYLVEHARRLVGHSGVGMNGPAPLTWPALESYSRQQGWEFAPWEQDALMRLDVALRTPAPGAAEAPKPDGVESERAPRAPRARSPRARR